MSTTTDLSVLKINYLTQEQYEDALEDGLIQENELYMTPSSGGGGSGVPPIESQDNWKYRIYEDNTFEAWYKQTGYTITITNASGNLYRSNLTQLVLPTNISSGHTITIQHTTVNCAHNNYPCWGMVGGYDGATINFYAMSGGSRSSSPNYTLDAYVFGTIA